MAISAVTADADQNNSKFCNSLRDLPLSNIKKTEKAVHEINTIRTSDYSQDNGRSVEAIEKTISPYNLSDDLKKEFQNKIGDDDHDYDVYRTPDASVFNFSTVEGSEKCAVDVWAFNTGGKLEKIDSVPDLGDSCDVVRIYGAYQGFPILVQYSYAPSSGTNTNLARKKIDEIRVLRIVKDKFDDVCVIKPK